MFASRHSTILEKCQRHGIGIRLILVETLDNAGVLIMASAGERRDRVSSGKFEQIVRTEYRRVYGFAWHLTRDGHNAVDLTQETFRVACEKWHSFAGNSSVATWLHQIAFRKFVDQQRSGKTKRRVHGELTQQCIREYQSNQRTAQAGHVNLFDSKQDILDAIEQLDEADRLIIVLRYLQELSVADAALVTGMPAGTVKWRASKAMSKLRAILAPERKAR